MIDFTDPNARETANERGSRHFDMSHQLEQFDRERAAWRFGWAAAVFVLVVVAGFLYATWP